mmetsp:Transcript_50903/g.65184  ORF Transcript_50903/g.65184 Transcript_50903/m.65184 type:complete len:107 (+) Transcript_50903:26-346(+)
MGSYGTATDVENNGTSLLHDAVRITEESQTIANQTTDQMYSQRNQLQGAQDQVMYTRNVTKEAHQKIVELQQKLKREKCILTTIVLVLILINVLIIYRLATNHGKF